MSNPNLRPQAASWLAFCGLAAFPLLLPFARLSELGILLCLASVVWQWRSWRVLVQAASVRAALWAWTFIFTAAVISSIDAWAINESWGASASLLRFAALPLAAAMLDARQLRYLSYIIASIAAIWALDALGQAYFGISLGGSSKTDRISGVFGDDNLKLGLVLPLLAPTLLSLSEGRKSWMFFAWLLLGTSILLAGARAGWIMFALLSVCWCYRLSGNNWRRSAAYLLLAAFALGALGVALYRGSSGFAERVDRTLQAFNGSGSTGLDFALAGRPPIWQTAIRMSADHPINGVGVRGFRFAYPNYAAPNDPWVQEIVRDGELRKTGATHPHQLFLELSSETGLVGLSLWLLAAFAVIRAYRECPIVVRQQAWPFAMPVFILVFPLNTHTALYSSFWAGVLWWLLALLAAAMRRPEAMPQKAGLS